MPAQAPVTHHLDLYEYWLATRGSCMMPSRGDLNPGDIPTLLPHMIIIDKADGKLRWRLAGTAVAQEAGHEPTGSFVGSTVLQALYERVFNCASPIFVTAEYKTCWGAIHNVSLLILPLSDDGTKVKMAVSTLVARFSFDAAPATDWLEGLRVKVRDVVAVAACEELEMSCREWERHCDDQRLRAERITPGPVKTGRYPL